MAYEIVQVLQIDIETRTIQSTLNYSYKVSLEYQEAHNFKIKS